MDTSPGPGPAPESPEPHVERALCPRVSHVSLDGDGYAKVSEAGSPEAPHDLVLDSDGFAALSEAGSPDGPTALSFDDTGFAVLSDEEAAAPAPAKKAKKDYLAAADAAAQEPLPGARSLKYMFKKPSGLEPSKVGAAPGSKHPIGQCVNDF